MKKLGCGIGMISCVILGIFNFIVGSLSVLEILSWFGKSIPFIYSGIIGLFVAEISIPIAIIGHILRMFNIA